MLNWLNYHHLLYFKTIATEGSIANASKKLKVGSSALSAQLKQLEEQLGQKLFERKGRSLLLTGAGRVALDYANEIFQKGEEFMQVFNEEDLSLKQRYRIGVTDSISKSLAYMLMETAEEVGRDCFFSLTEGTPEELKNKVMEHQIDIALTNVRANPKNEGLIIKFVGESSVSIFGSNKYQNLIANFPESLSGQPFILPTSHSNLRYDIEHAFHELNLQYNLLAEVQDSSVKKLMGTNGKGLIFLPEIIGQELVNDKKLIKIGHFANLKEDYWLITKKRTIKTPITDSLLKNFKINLG